MTNDDRSPAIDRPLTDDERDLMRQLAIWSVAEQTGVSAQEAANASSRCLREPEMALTAAHSLTRSIMRCEPGMLPEFEVQVHTAASLAAAAFGLEHQLARGHSQSDWAIAQSDWSFFIGATWFLVDYYWLPGPATLPTGGTVLCRCQVGERQQPTWRAHHLAPVWVAVDFENGDKGRGG